MIHTLRRNPLALLNLVYRDQLRPRAAYRHRFDYWCERLSERSACKLMVALLSLAQDRACEAQLAVSLREDLAAHRLPDLKDLRSRFAPDEEGCWACLLDTDRVVRVAPDGARTHAVVIPGGEPIACTLGGKDGRQMFITAIESLAGKNIFAEMMAKRVRANVWTAEVQFSKGTARP